MNRPWMETMQLIAFNIFMIAVLILLALDAFEAPVRRLLERTRRHRDRPEPAASSGALDRARRTASVRLSAVASERQTRPAWLKVVEGPTRVATSKTIDDDEPSSSLGRVAGCDAV